MDHTHVICQKLLDEFEPRERQYPKFNTRDVIEMLKRIRDHDLAYCAAEEQGTIGKSWIQFFIAQGFLLLMAIVVCVAVIAMKLISENCHCF